MTQSDECPVCRSQDGFACQVGSYEDKDASLFECEVCGSFAISRTAIVSYFGNTFRFSRVQSAALSHLIRVNGKGHLEPRLLSTDDIESLLGGALSLPNPALQALNIIRFIGDRVIENGEPIELLPPEFTSEIGAPSRRFAIDLVNELKNRTIVDGVFHPTGGTTHIQNLSLTLAGWERYEAERQGKLAGKYGFIAMKFGDPILDPLIRDHVKPAISGLGYEAVDLRDVARAGVIDNILRVQIRDAAFVIVDLTHENAGAYWEAGYAEGLGKPVLYICEKSKFDEKKTHFDTNHCTTILWHIDSVDEFTENLSATLRRSLSI